MIQFIQAIPFLDAYGKLKNNVEIVLKLCL